MSAELSLPAAHLETIARWANQLLYLPIHPMTETATLPPGGRHQSTGPEESARVCLIIEVV